MKFYIDESGDYRVPENLITHKACVTLSIAVSDLIRKELRAEFERFCSKLNASEHENGEPKGAKLSKENRAEFCELLSRFKGGLLVIPTTVDLSLIAFLQKEQKPIQERMYQHLNDLTKIMLHESMREDLRLLAKQFSNLSQQQCLKVFSLVNCIYESLHNAIIFLSTHGHEASWETISYEIDRTNVRPNSREKIVFSKMIGGWISAWSKSKPFTLIKEIHTPNHPFVRNFDTLQGIDGNKLIEGKIIWSDSRKSWGVRLADFASNIVYNAVNDLDDRNGNATLFASLMRSSPYSFKKGPGLISPYKKIPNDILKLFRGKYRLLSEFMRIKETNNPRSLTN